MKQVVGIIIGLTLLGLSCEKVDRYRIPASPVSLELDLLTNATTLVTIGNAVRYHTPKPLMPADFPFTITSRTGYGGLLVIHGFDDIMYAFDLSCPVEASPDIRLTIDNTLTATCPSCESQFDTGYGIGNPIKGVAFDKKYPLQRYTVTKTANSKYYIYR